MFVSFHGFGDVMSEFGTVSIERVVSSGDPSIFLNLILFSLILVGLITLCARKGRPCTNAVVVGLVLLVSASALIRASFKVSNWDLKAASRL
jgi:hypothetical protein